jgi:hypothetical protein
LREFPFFLDPVVSFFVLTMSLSVWALMSELMLVLEGETERERERKECSPRTIRKKLEYEV